MFRVIPSEEISHRIDFSLLCNSRGIRQAVEVGVEYGVFATQFLSHWHGDLLVLVDDFAPHQEHPGNRIPDIVTTCLALHPYHGRFRFLGMSSPQAVQHFPMWVRPGFIYIDASHDYKSVQADLLAWWPLVTLEGMLAGHDYDPGHPGVMQAVDEFARDRGLCVRLTKDALPSWYIYKNEPVELHHLYFREGRSPNPEYST